MNLMWVTKTKMGKSHSALPHFVQSIRSWLFVRRRTVALPGIRLATAIRRHSSRWSGRRWRPGTGRTSLRAIPAVVIGGASLSGVSLRRQFTRHALQIGIRRSRLESCEHALERFIGRKSAIREAADDEQRNRQRPAGG